MSKKIKQDTAPPISVLMSVYNGGVFLRKSIESILGQTCRDFEFLIIDDASTDSTPDILAEYEKTDSRLHIIKNDSNVGLTLSLNRGLKMACGRYIARMDADDISFPERLKKQFEYLELNPDVGIVGTALQIIDNEGVVKAKRFPATEHHELVAELLIKNFSFTHTSVMMRRSAIEQVGPYDKSIKFAQDYELWWRISRKWKLANLSDVLVNLRESELSISKSYRKEQLECMYEISLSIIEEKIGLKKLDEAAYRRFWWAINGFIEELCYRDINRLNILFDEIYIPSLKLSGTRSAVRGLIVNLIRSRRFKVGLALQKMIKSKGDRGIGFGQLSKHLIKAFVA